MLCQNALWHPKELFSRPLFLKSCKNPKPICCTTAPPPKKQNPLLIKDAESFHNFAVISSFFSDTCLWPCFFCVGLIFVPQLQQNFLPHFFNQHAPSPIICPQVVSVVLSQEWAKKNNKWIKPLKGLLRSSENRPGSEGGRGARIVLLWPFITPLPNICRASAAELLIMLDL